MVKSLGVDQSTFITTMGAFPTGVTVVTTVDRQGKPRGLTCNAFTSVSVTPPLLLICVSKESVTLNALLDTRRFAINFLARGRGELANHFASKHPDKFAQVTWARSARGMPLLIQDAIAFADCSVVQTVEAGDHYVLIGLVEEAQPPSPKSEPLVYFRKRYGTVQFDPCRQINSGDMNSESSLPLEVES